MPKGIRILHISVGARNLTHFGGIFFYSSILQETTSQMAFAKLCEISLLSQTLSSRRINPGYHLCTDCWCPPFKQNKDSSGQRRFSTDCRLKELPIFQRFKAFLKKSQSHNNPRYQQGSRPSEAKDLLFLSAKSRDRNYHQGIERKFRFSQNPNQQLPGQSNLFFFAPFCLQYRQLVQETLSTTEISECYLRNHSDRVLSITSQVGQNRPPEYTQITSRIYLRANIETHYSENYNILASKSHDSCQATR